jgi:ATP-dependent DNA helicase RecQ
MESQTFHQILEKRFALNDFRRGQLEIIQSIMGRQDTLAVMPTGGGKSLCYQLPAFALKGTVLVISPLIALMRDQVEALQRQGIPSGCLHSGQTLDEKRKVFREMKEAETFLLYVSPERVQKDGFASWIKTAPVTLIAVDEAHCLSQWGPDFRPDYYRLSLLRELRADVPILALTATATPQVLRDISARLNLQKPDSHVYGFYRPNLYYQVEQCESEGQKNAMLEEAVRSFPDGKIIIYCGTRKQCEAVDDQLSKLFSAVDYYHAGLNADQRKQVEKSFEKGETRILAATNAFGMGVNHPDVRLVVHYQMPSNIESYYQEVGRAGRDGESSTCLMLYSKKDKGLHSYFIRNSDAPPEIIQHRWNALDTIVQYAEGGECRHAGILTYFRDTQRINRCGHCDICFPASERRVESVEELKNILLVSQKKKKKKSVSSSSARPLTPEEQLRLEVIREWRLEYARERDLPAFLIFSNRTLTDLAKLDPAELKSSSDLDSIYGLGDKKIQVFGKELLKCLSECR